MTNPTAPDAALLWAREEAANQTSDDWLARMTVEGRRDDALAVSCRAIGFRAGQGHAAGLLEALEGLLPLVDVGREAAQLAAMEITETPRADAVKAARAAIAAAKGV
jgi:hypothetical protein